jgi:hypothetical protein
VASEIALAKNAVIRRATGGGGKKSNDMKNIIIGELFSAL